MADYPISKEAVIKMLLDLRNSLGNERYISIGITMALHQLEGFPQMDAVPVVHSSWGYRAYRGDARITASGEVVCRKCHAPFFRIRGHWFKYCPNCGARMDAKDMDVPTKDGGASDA